MTASASAHRALAIYRGKETNAHYNMGLGILTAISVCVPLIAGQLSGRAAAGDIAALAAWFLSPMMAPRNARRRAFEFGRRVFITTAATTLGVVIGGDHILGLQWRWLDWAYSSLSPA